MHKHLEPMASAKWDCRNETIPITMATQMLDGKHTSSSAHYACRCAATDRSRSRCGQKKVIMKPLWHAFLFVSFLSFAICFPSDHVTIAKAQRKGKVGSKSPFHRITEAPTSQHTFLPDVFVLSLSSTSFDRGETKNDRQITRKSNKITVQTLDKDGRELPLRTIEYRRRKHEWAERYTRQEGLREAFGSNRNKWWGDLDAKTARRLYKRLLFPTALSELVLELGDEIVRPEELAPLAYEARRAAKMYARERCRVPSRVGAYLFDGFRQWRKYGRFQPNGVSYEQLWIRYYEENGNHIKTEEEWEYMLSKIDDGSIDNIDDIDDIIDDIDDAVTEDEIIKRTCKKIFEKASTTNEAIDRFFLKEYNVNATRTYSEDIMEKHTSHEDDGIGGKNGRGKRWRKKKKKRKDRYNDLLLERITETLERDVRKLIEPPPSSLSTNIAYGEGDAIDGNQCDQTHSSIGDYKSGRNEGNLSSRRMTPREYHSLKLFAKARKHSQQQQAKDNHLDDSSKAQLGSKNKIKIVPVLSPDGEIIQDQDED